MKVQINKKQKYFNTADIVKSRNNNEGSIDDETFRHLNFTRGKKKNLTISMRLDSKDDGNGTDAGAEEEDQPQEFEEQ